MQSKLSRTVLRPLLPTPNTTELGNFQIKHVASGRCWSFTAGQNSDRVILNGNCAEDFTYDANGGLKHVSSSRCTFVEELTSYINMKTCDNSLNALIDKNIQGVMMIKPTSNGEAIHAAGTGGQGEYLKNETVTSSTVQENAFHFMPALPSTPITLEKKLVLFSSTGSLLFFCSRHYDRSKPSCFYTNTSSQGGWKALPAALGNIKGYNPTAHLLYGVDSRGIGYMEIDLNESPLKISQIDEAHWTARSSGLVQSQIISQSSLGDSLTAIPNTSEYSYNLRGIFHAAAYQAAKLMVRWS